MKRIAIYIIVVILVIQGGNIIMAEYNIQMVQRNASNTDWDKHYPVTKAENVISSEGNIAIDLLSKADRAYVDALGASIASGAPSAASLVSQMINTAKNYVYTGTETGYTAGHWYWWNGTAWTDGGVYQAEIPVEIKQTKQFGSDDIPSADYAGISNVTRIDGTVISYDGKLKAVTFRTDGVYAVKIQFFSLVSGAQFKTMDEVALTTVSGLYTYRAGIDFPEIDVKKGWYIGIASANANIPYSDAVAGVSFSKVGISALGATNTYAQSGYRILINADIAIDTDTVVQTAISQSLENQAVVGDVDKKYRMVGANIRTPETAGGAFALHNDAEHEPMGINSVSILNGDLIVGMDFTAAKVISMTVTPHVSMRNAGYEVATTGGLSSHAVVFYKNGVKVNAEDVVIEEGSFWFSGIFLVE